MRRVVHALQNPERRFTGGLSRIVKRSRDRLRRRRLAVWRTRYEHVRILLTLLFALGAFATNHAVAQDQRMVIFAAASLKDALDEVNAAYKQAKGIEIVTSYAGSGALIKQIEQGAPAEVFISADLESMDYGSQKKVIQDNTRVNLLGNKLVLIAAGGFQDRQRHHQFQLRPCQAGGRQPHRHRRRAGGSGRTLRAGGAGKARTVDRGAAEACHGGERAPGAVAGGARRSARSASSTRPTPRPSRR